MTALRPLFILLAAIAILQAPGLVPTVQAATSVTLSSGGSGGSDQACTHHDVGAASLIVSAGNLDDCLMMGSVERTSTGVNQLTANWNGPVPIGANVVTFGATFNGLTGCTGSAWSVTASNGVVGSSATASATVTMTSNDCSGYVELTASIPTAPVFVFRDRYSINIHTPDLASYVFQCGPTLTQSDAQNPGLATCSPNYQAQYDFQCGSTGTTVNAQNPNAATCSPWQGSVYGFQCGNTGTTVNAQNPNAATCHVPQDMQYPCNPNGATASNLANTAQCLPPLTSVFNYQCQGLGFEPSLYSPASGSNIDNCAPIGQTIPDSQHCDSPYQFQELTSTAFQNGQTCLKYPSTVKASSTFPLTVEMNVPKSLATPTVSVSSLSGCTAGAAIDTVPASTGSFMQARIGTTIPLTMTGSQCSGIAVARSPSSGTPKYYAAVPFVITTDDHPTTGSLSISQSGAWNVGLSGSITANLAGTVNIGTLPTVNVAGTMTNTIASWPTLSASVGITSIPSLNIASIPTLTVNDQVHILDSVVMHQILDGTAHLHMDGGNLTIAGVNFNAGNVTTNAIFPSTLHLCGAQVSPGDCTSVASSSGTHDQDWSVILLIVAFGYAWYRAHITGWKWLWAVVILAVGCLTMTLPVVQQFTLAATIATIVSAALVMLVINRFGIHAATESAQAARDNI